MGFLKKLVSPVLGGLLGVGANALLGGKKKKLPVQPASLLTSRDEAIDQIEAEDELRRRRGAAADLISGTRGVEAGARSIGRLIVGS